MTGLLYETYKPRFYWFEPVALLRRTLLILMSVYVESSAARFTLFTMFAIGCWLLHRLVRLAVPEASTLRWLLLLGLCFA